jgi:hypothetical protein
VQIKAIRLDATTDGDGDATATATLSIMARLFAVEWIDGDLADGVDAVLSTINTPSAVDQTLLTLTDANVDKWYFPRVLLHSEAGAALTGTQGGDRGMMVINGTLKLVIASGGDTKTGGCIVYYI